MIPDETGRYCNSCKKSVIDFTAKTDEEIKQFIINNLNQQLCGRFKNTQIHRIVIDLPQNIFSIQMPLWMRFLVACLLIFGFSIFPFETTIAGKTPVATAFYQGEPIKVDTAKTLRILKKKKRKKHRKNIFEPGDIIWSTTMGFMPTPGPYPPDISILDTSFKINYESDVQLVANSETLPNKEQPHPTPYTPAEFILPSILSIRKENNTQSMD